VEKQMVIKTTFYGAAPCVVSEGAVSLPFTWFTKPEVEWEESR